jgi:chromosome segregation ATPase
MVSQDPPERISQTSLQTVRDTVGQLQQQEQIFQSFLEEMLDGLEGFRNELGQREADLAGAQTEVAARQQELNEALEEVHGKSEIHASQQQQLDELTQRLDTCRQHVTQLEGERDEARAQLEQTVDELDALSQTLTGAESTSQELEQARSELSTVRQQLQEQVESGAGQLEQLQQEKDQLQEELSSTRKQTEALASQIEERDEELSELRERLSRELHELRDAMALRDSALQEALTAEGSQQSPVDGEGSDAAECEMGQLEGNTNREDPVLDSVLAKFAELEETTRILDEKD